MKADVLRFPKMRYFLGLAVFKVEFGPQSKVKFQKKSPAKKMSQKRHGHNFDFSALKRIAWQLYIVENPCYSFHEQNPKIVAVSFFVTSPIFDDAPTFAALC